MTYSPPTQHRFVRTHLLLQSIYDAKIVIQAICTQEKTHFCTFEYKLHHHLKKKILLAIIDKLFTYTILTLYLSTPPPKKTKYYILSKYYNLLPTYFFKNFYLATSVCIMYLQSTNSMKKQVYQKENILCCLKKKIMPLLSHLIFCTRTK